MALYNWLLSVLSPGETERTGASSSTAEHTAAKFIERLCLKFDYVGDENDKNNRNHFKIISEYLLSKVILKIYSHFPYGKF